MRITRKNPASAPGGVDTYRIPFASGERWRTEKAIGEPCIFGEVADKLGRYEDLGEPEELEKKLDKKGDK